MTAPTSTRGLELSMQLLHLGRVLPGQVARLAEIGGDVEQLEGAVFIPLDELPLAVANRAKGCAAQRAGVMGVMPEQRAASSVPPLSRGTRLTPSRCCAGASGRPASSRNVGSRSVDSTRLWHTLPGSVTPERHDPRRADAPLVGPALAARNGR